MSLLSRLRRHRQPDPPLYPVEALLNFADETGAVDLAVHTVRLPGDAASGAFSYLPLDVLDGSLALVGYPGTLLDSYRKVNGRWLQLAPRV